MTETVPEKYFDLHTTGIGYLNRVREVTPREGSPFMSVTIAALRGRADDVQYSYFECRVSGKKARDIVRSLVPAIDSEHKVLASFKLSDLSAQSFTYLQGERAGDTGVRLKSRLLRLMWVKVDGAQFYREEEVTA